MTLPSSGAHTPPDGSSLDRLASLVAGEVRGGDPVVDEVWADSRQVTPGSLFCAVRGDRVDGHSHADEAVRRGASALVVERWLPLHVPQLRVPWTRAAVGPIAAAVHGNPGDGLPVVAVTGTNGKTTTAALTESALRAGGRAPGLLGTVEYRSPGWSQPSTLTTPEAPELQRLLATMRDHRADCVVLEASSQGLDQRRLDGLRVDVGVFLNLGAEHLDYHGTVEQYFAAKASLFERGRCAHALVCVDDTWGRRLAAQLTIPVTTFGRDRGADVRFRPVRTGTGGTVVRVAGVDGGAELFAPVVGTVNAANMVAAYLSARRLGVSPARAAQGLAATPDVPGRCQRIDAGQPFLVLVDYAHTPDALAALLATARDLSACSGDLHLVVGCRGGKDRFKRPLIGRVATGADRPVLTTDSPGPEDPGAILEQMLAGTLDCPRECVVVEPDRRRAIRNAIAAARRGDVVVIAGRGHESTRSFDGHIEKFDDRDVAVAALADLGYAERPGGADVVALTPGRSRG